MSNLVLTDALLALDKYSFSGMLAALSLDLAGDAPDSTVMGTSGARSHAVGLRGFGLEARGFWDSSLDLGLSAFPSNTPFTAAQLSTAGAIAYVGLANETDYGRGGVIGEVFPFSVGLMGRESLGRGTLLQNAALTATANSTGSQIGALSATQIMICNLHIPTVSGSAPTLDAIVQSDDNAGFSSPTTRGTFTQKTAAGVQQLIISGAITDDYWRIAFAIGGSSPSFLAIGALGRAG